MKNLYIYTVSYTQSFDSELVLLIGGRLMNARVRQSVIRASMSEVVATFRLACVSVEIDTRNAASMAVVERLGFVLTRLVPPCC